jgi:hypothetical protein
MSPFDAALRALLRVALRARTAAIGREQRHVGSGLYVPVGTYKRIACISASIEQKM